ncbi:MAG TPA: histidine phosphatase family protein [Candidatus Cybelea sp.]|nr:histidine phosphatase family protein [Candidatus Cybelea sp.]
MPGYPRAPNQEPLSLKTLYLLRHAKSAWDRPELDDHDRGLNARGRAACDALAKHMRRAGIKPALVLVSSARRAQETWSRIAAALQRPPPVREAADLYMAEIGDLLRILRDVDDRAASVMLVGHNPGLEELAHEIVGGGAQQALKRMATKFPTGALATIELPAKRWRDVAGDEGRLTDFVTPASLEEA